MQWTTSSPPLPSSAAPRMRRSSASTRIFMKPWLLQPQLVGVGAAPDGEQQMRGGHFRSLARAIHCDRNFPAAPRDAQTLGAAADLDTFVLENFGDAGGNVVILPRDQPRLH